VTDHDHPYKRLFSQKEVVSDLLTGFVTGLAQDADLDSLERTNGSYVSEDWREREDDIVWRLRTRSGDMYVYLLIEFQSSVDPDMALRIMTYLGLLWQDLRRTGTAPAGTPLPPVLPLVLYNGEQLWTAPTDLSKLIAAYPASLATYQPRLSYLLLDEVRMAMSQHLAVRNLAGAVFALEQGVSPDGLFATGIAVAEFLRASGRGHLIHEYSLWWGRTLSRVKAPNQPNPFEDSSMIAERMRRWQEEYIQQGMARGLAEGKAEGKAEGEIAEIRRLVAKGRLSVDAARAEINDLIASRTIPEALGREALTLLG
jgi:hypothetical protein